MSARPLDAGLCSGKDINHLDSNNYIIVSITWLPDYHYYYYLKSFQIRVVCFNQTGDIVISTALCGVHFHIMINKFAPFSL